jgi:hypothetical protein
VARIAAPIAASRMITPSPVKIVFSPVIELPPPVSAPPRGASGVVVGLAFVALFDVGALEVGAFEAGVPAGSVGGRLVAGGGTAPPLGLGRGLWAALVVELGPCVGV